MQPPVEEHQPAEVPGARRAARVRLVRRAAVVRAVRPVRVVEEEEVPADALDLPAAPKQPEVGAQRLLERAKEPLESSRSSTGGKAESACARRRARRASPRTCRTETPTRGR